MQSTPRLPVITSAFWRICEMPDLGPLAHVQAERQNVVDHGFYLAPDGDWRLWAAIRGTAVGHIICAWRGSSLESSTPWTYEGVVLQARKEHGERTSTDPDRGHVCAPSFVRHEGQWNCFYNSEGIHRLSSQDGLQFERKLDAQARSLSHVGGRDVMIAWFDDRYFAYSCVTRVSRDGWRDSFVIVRTSPDLEAWSDYTIVSAGGIAGNGPVSAESPFVARVGGYYYLFRASSITFTTFVYRSATPYNFGVNDDRCLIGELPLKAPELIEYDNQWYISDLADFQGIKLAKMEWR